MARRLADRFRNCRECAAGSKTADAAIGKQADVLKLRAFFTKLQSDVRQEIAAGRTREQAMDDVKDAEYANYPGGAARLRTNVGIIYDQLKSGR